MGFLFGIDTSGLPRLASSVRSDIFVERTPFRKLGSSVRSGIYVAPNGA